MKRRRAPRRPRHAARSWRRVRVCLGDGRWASADVYVVTASGRANPAEIAQVLAAAREQLRQQYR